MDQAFNKQPIFSAWPFWALELTPEADNRTIEKSYSRILGCIQLKIPNAEVFITPLGQQTRDEFMLREAKSILQNPEKRVIAEFWYIPADNTFEKIVNTNHDTNKIIVELLEKFESNTLLGQY